MGVGSFDALGFDPAPGDVARTGDVAATVRAVVDALSEVEGILAGERDGRWEGKSAAAFRDIVADELTPRVQRALSSFSEAADALQRWVGQLESFQRRAQRLEERARAARDDLQAAQLSLDALPQPRHVAEDQPDDAQHDRDRAQGRVDSAHGVLAGILDEATSLREEVEAAAGETSHRLDVSASSAPDEPGVFERIGEVLSNIGSWIVSAIANVFDWIMENVVPIIEAALPYIAFALAVAALFTTGGLGGILLVLAGAGIGIDTVQALRGEGSWGDVALGVASLAGGMALGRIAGRFMAMRDNAFQIRLNSPGVALPGRGVVPGSATAVIQFHPNMYNVGTMGWATTKFTDLYQSIPAPLKPQPPRKREKPR